MLFIAEYQVKWDQLEAAVAKRLDWQEIKPEGFNYLGEYLWHEGDPPFKGIAVIEAASVEDIHTYVLHYGPTLTLKVNPATDLMTGLQTLQKLAEG